MTAMIARAMIDLILDRCTLVTCDICLCMRQRERERERERERGEKVDTAMMPGVYAKRKVELVEN